MTSNGQQSLFESGPEAIGGELVELRVVRPVDTPLDFERWPETGRIPDVDLSKDIVYKAPLGSTDSEAAARDRHPASTVQAPIGEDPDDPVIVEWVNMRQAADARIGRPEPTNAEKNRNERRAIARHRRRVSKQVLDPGY